MPTEVSVVTVSSKGQIVLPERFREEMKLKKGTHLLIVKESDVLILKKEESAKDDFKDLTRLAERSLKALWGGKEEDIWSKYLEE